jgi:hypothetical protein
MRRLFAASIGLALTAGLLVAPVAAKGNDVFDLHVSWRDNQRWVEQQSSKTPIECEQDITGCVWNPTEHLWDIDSRVIFVAGGNLAAGASSTAADSVIADRALHMTGVNVTSPSPDLLVSITFQPQDVTWDFTPLLVDGEYEYRGCVVGPIYQNTPPEGEVIPDSNGGRGWVTNYTLTVTNPTNRTVRNNGAQFTYRSSEPFHIAQFCRTLPSPSTYIVLGGAGWRDGR